MDKRNTLSAGETFLQILSDCKERNAVAAMLLDDNGITRAEGLIKGIFANDPLPYIELENGTKIILKTIIAVNGIFSPSYSEC